MAEQVQHHILQQFQIIQKIGSGAYGIVWKVQHKITKQIFALKKIFDAFQHSTDAQRTYRQIVFLKEFQHDNIIKLYDVIRAENDKDIYLLFQHMEIDLHSVIRENILKQKHKQYIIYQIAKALKYLHSTNLIHRDLKPSNILINSQCLVKICDFGLIRSLNKQFFDQQLILSQYVATRWYRAPQILLGSRAYTKGVDVWSFGCLMAQLIKGKPMFIGQSTLNQLQKIFQWTGIPKSQDIKQLGQDLMNIIMQKLGGIKQRNVKQLLPSIDDDALDLIRRMLQFSPKKRITIQQILQHPYLKQFHNPQNQPKCQKIIKSQIDDNKKLSVKEYRQLIYQLINKKQKEKKDILNSEIKCELIKQQKKKRKKSVRNTLKQYLQQREQAIKKFLFLNKKQMHFLTPLKNNNFDKVTNHIRKNESVKHKNLTQGREISVNKNHIYGQPSTQTSKKHSLKYTMYYSKQKKAFLDENDKKKQKSIYSNQKKNPLVLKYLNKGDRQF